jgi:iron-sulfur cluster insertion protein
MQAADIWFPPDYLELFAMNIALEPVGLSARAAQRVAHILKAEAPGAMFRVAVNGGGCSGFQYAFDIVSERSSDDLVLEREGATVLIDPVSLDFLKGSQIDFVDDLIGQSFKIENPNATASCGCGTSFAI